jgi:FAD/FMN-containing dehydrogenase
MSTITVNDQKVEEFRASLRGRVLQPGDSGYDQARAIWNGMIDKHPALIAQCADAQDVMAAVAFARENDLPASVKGGGHNIAGNALCDDGLVIDLTLLKQVQVDIQTRTARAGGGVTWGEFDRATQEYGLAVTGGLVSTTGIGGFTLGGGMGWLERKHGLTCDNLIAAEVVTAEGKMVRANAEENPDLFWALRGGGGNFGIVTEFTYRLHPVGPAILGGMLVWPFSETERILQFYREYTADLPEELTTMAGTVTAPPAPFVPLEMQGKQCVAVVGCYAGPIEDGKHAIAPLRELSPAADLFGEMPYVALQSMLDGMHPAGPRSYWKSDYLDTLSDDAIRVIVARFREVPSPRTHVDIHDLGGAIRRVPEDDTAFSHRDANYVFNIVSIWTDPADDELNINWSRDLWNALRPYATGATYINFMGSEGEDRVKASYGPKYQRLAEVKRKYDPTNFFRLNQNIKPAE